MSSSNRYTENCRCCICGRVMTPPSERDDMSFTVDHIYPKSGNKQNDAPVRLQYCCKSCNKLKAHHVPTALLYRIVTAFQMLNMTYPEIKLTAIEDLISDNARRVYRLTFVGKYKIIIPSDLGHVMVLLENPRACKVYYSCKEQLQQALDYVLLRPGGKPPAFEIE